MNRTYYEKNRKRLYDLLGDDFNITLRGGTTDFLYLTGIDRDDVAFSAASKAGKVEEIFYIPPYDPMKERWFGRMLRADDVGFGTVVECETLPEGSGEIPEIANVRTIKTKEDIEAINKAIALTGRGIDKILLTAKPGMHEYNIRAEFEKVLADEGCHIPAFDSIVGAGKNSLCLHYPECDGIVNDGDTVLLDLGAKYDGLCADISRVFPINGKFDEHSRVLTQLACDTVDYVCENIRMNEDNRQLNKLQDEYLLPRLKELGLEGKVEDYRWHNISHHLGYDVHDSMPRETPLYENTVFTLEVGLYVNDWGFGVRIEDDALMTKDGCINLSRFIPRNPDEIELAMARKYY